MDILLSLPELPELPQFNVNEKEEKTLLLPNDMFTKQSIFEDISLRDDDNNLNVFKKSSVKLNELVDKENNNRDICNIWEQYSNQVRNNGTNNNSKDNFKKNNKKLTWDDVEQTNVYNNYNNNDLYNIYNDEMLEKEMEKDYRKEEREIIDKIMNMLIGVQSDKFIFEEQTFKYSYTTDKNNKIKEEIIKNIIELGSYMTRIQYMCDYYKLDTTRGGLICQSFTTTIYQYYTIYLNRIINLIEYNKQNKNITILELIGKLEYIITPINYIANLTKCNVICNSQFEIPYLQMDKGVTLLNNLYINLLYSTTTNPIKTTTNGTTNITDISNNLFELTFELFKSSFLPYSNFIINWISTGNLIMDPFNEFPITINDFGNDTSIYNTHLYWSNYFKVYFSNLFFMNL